MLVDMEYIGGNFSASSQNVDTLKGVVKQRRVSQWSGLSVVTSMGHSCMVYIPNCKCYRNDMLATYYSVLKTSPTNQSYGDQANT